MQPLISICVIILCLISVIAIHELGHALAAKAFGVKINKISLGFGKTICSWQSKSGYTIDLNILLIGGRVNLLNNRTNTIDREQYIYCFDRQPIWVRTIILLSGSIANAFAAFLALVFMIMLGFNQLKPNIAEVTPGSYAAQAGLMAESTINSINDQPVKYFRDLGMQLIMNLGREKVAINFCDKKNKCHESFINLNIWNRDSKEFSIFKAIGFTPEDVSENIIKIKGESLGQAIISGLNQLASLTCFFLVMIKQILTGSIPFAALIGPFKFFEAIIDSFSQGLATFLYFIANFSLAMAIANLLPIPTLDGGSIIYGLIEKIRGKPLSIALEILIYRLVFTAFAIFIVQLIVNDLKYYF